MQLRQIVSVVLISSLSALGTITAYQQFVKPLASSSNKEERSSSLQFAKYGEGFTGHNSSPADFTKAASLSLPAVVHINTHSSAKKVSGEGDELLYRMFGIQTNVIPEEKVSGSGVIIREDGYIITNNHVVANEDGSLAEEITVTLSNHKTYKAKLLGRDAAKDIALLKIDDTDLPYLSFGNSDAIQTGQWVLAVGYPLSLEATVTAGIISATGSKPLISGRAGNRSSERSYIQTDAAVNQGSSGGALVNIDGDLIGINAAIFSPTGTYAGYSFAIPASVVKKAVKDILQSTLPKTN